MLCWETHDETILGSELLLPLGSLQLGSDSTGALWSMSNTVRTMVAANNYVLYFFIRYPTCLMTFSSSNIFYKAFFEIITKLS